MINKGCIIKSFKAEILWWVMWNVTIREDKNIDPVNFLIVILYQPGKAIRFRRGFNVFQVSFESCIQETGRPFYQFIKIGFADPVKLVRVLKMGDKNVKCFISFFNPVSIDFLLDILKLVLLYIRT